MRRYLIASAATFMMASLTTAAHADEALPPAIAPLSDRLPIELAASAAKRERMMIIQENMERQRYDGPGYDRGYGWYGGGPRYYAPPPPRWEPADRWDDDWDDD